MKRALMALVFSGLLLNSSGAMASMIGQCNALLAKFSGAGLITRFGIEITDFGT